MAKIHLPNVLGIENGDTILLNPGTGFNLLVGGIEINIEMTQDTFSISSGDRVFLDLEKNGDKWEMDWPRPEDDTCELEREHLNAKLVANEEFGAGVFD